MSEKRDKRAAKGGAERLAHLLAFEITTRIEGMEEARTFWGNLRHKHALYFDGRLDEARALVNDLARILAEIYDKHDIDAIIEALEDEDKGA